MFSFCFTDRESSIKEHGSRAEERAINLLTDSTAISTIGMPDSIPLYYLMQLSYLIPNDHR